MFNREEPKKKRRRPIFFYAILVAAAVLFSSQVFVESLTIQGNGITIGTNVSTINFIGTNVTGDNNSVNVTIFNCPLDTYCYDSLAEVQYTAYYNLTYYSDNVTYQQTQFIQVKA